MPSSNQKIVHVVVVSLSRSTRNAVRHSPDMIGLYINMIVIKAYELGSTIVNFTCARSYLWKESFNAPSP